VLGGKFAIGTGIALLLLQQGFSVSAVDDPCPPGPSLARFIGSYDSDALLRDPQVDGPLRALLGDQYTHLIENLDVRGRVDLIAPELSLPGNAVHGGGIEEAVLCVSLYDGTVSAAIFSQGEISVYSPRSDYTAQGLCIKDWITQVNSGHKDRLRQPDNVRMHPPGVVSSKTGSRY
jgi:hypothetical protein